VAGKQISIEYVFIKECLLSLRILFFILNNLSVLIEKLITIYSTEVLADIDTLIH
jgi:hypothetical protein